MMRAHKSTVLVAGAILFAGVLFSGQALSQNAPAQPAVQGASITPIGKVVTAAGSVSIEHVSAVVVQASLGGQSGGAKIGDSVYLGDVVSTGSDGRVGITFTDGTAFDLSPNARMVMNEFVYDPNSTSNSSLLSLTKGTFTFVAGKVAVQPVRAVAYLRYQARRIGCYDARHGHGLIVEGRRSYAGFERVRVALRHRQRARVRIHRSFDTACRG